MGHIKNWPKATGFVFVEPLFATFEEEVEFWRHLLECQECRLGLYDIPGTLDFELDGFWEEVARFVDGAHPSAEHRAQSVLQVRASARIAIEGKYTERFREYLSTWDRSSLLFHLQICSKCFFDEEVWDRVEALPNSREVVDETYQRLLAEL